MAHAAADSSETRQIRRFSNPRICGEYDRVDWRVTPTHIEKIPQSASSDPGMMGTVGEITPLLSKSLNGVLGRSRGHSGQNLGVDA